MERRDPLLGLGGLTTLLGLLIYGWVVRRLPGPEVDCGMSGDRVRDAWLVGLAPAAFVTACGCVFVALWASAGLAARERPRKTSVVLAAIVVALGLQWWFTGTDSPLVFWGLLARVALLPSLIVVPGLAAGRVVVPPQAPARRCMAVAPAAVLVEPADPHPCVCRDRRPPGHGHQLLVSIAA